MSEKGGLSHPERGFETERLRCHQGTVANGEDSRGVVEVLGLSNRDLKGEEESSEAA